MLRKILGREATLQWHDFNQLSWQGKYDILKVSAEHCECKLGHFYVRINAEQLNIEQFQDEFFLLSFTALNKLEIIREIDE